MTQRATLHPRSGYDSLRTYAPGNDVPCAVDLSDNTNLWGVPPAAASALAGTAPAEYTRYPSRYAHDLKEAIAARHGVSPGMIVTGAGSDGVLEPAIRAFGTPGDLLAHPDPTFVMARAFGIMNGLVPAPVPLTAEYDADPEELLATGARIIYLCSPNNPTGGSLSRDVMRRVVQRASGLVIVDEAYAEFAGVDALDLARESDRVLVVRTMSKAYGLAGLRIGYGIGAPAVVGAVEKARGPYTVSVAAERAAVAAMREGHEWVAARAADAVAARERLGGELRRRGLQPARSDANFVLVPLAGADDVARQLALHGVAVRAFTGLPRVSAALDASGGSAIRITVGPWAQVEAALAALDRVLQPGREP